MRWETFRLVYGNLLRILHYQSSSESAKFCGRHDKNILVFFSVNSVARVSGLYFVQSVMPVSILLDVVSRDSWQKSLKLPKHIYLGSRSFKVIEFFTNRYATSYQWLILTSAVFRTVYGYLLVRKSPLTLSHLTLEIMQLCDYARAQFDGDLPHNWTKCAQSNELRLCTE